MLLTIKPTICYRFPDSLQQWLDCFISQASSLCHQFLPVRIVTIKRRFVIIGSQPARATAREDVHIRLDLPRPIQCPNANIRQSGPSIPIATMCRKRTFWASINCLSYARCCRDTYTITGLSGKDNIGSSDGIGECCKGRLYVCGDRGRVGGCACNRGRFSAHEL